MSLKLKLDNMDSIKKLQNAFSKFPTIGSRTASRFVYYILSLPKEDIQELTSAILEAKGNVRFCNFCFNPFEGKGHRNKSYIAYRNYVPWLRALGFRVWGKPASHAASSAADLLLHG